MPVNQPIIDTMIGFPKKNLDFYEYIKAQTKDAASKKMEFPAEYLFHNVPMNLYSEDLDPVDVTIGEMDRHGITHGMVGVTTDSGVDALSRFPDRFVGSVEVDPNNIMGSLRTIEERHDELDIRAVTAFPAGCSPQVPIDDRRFYPVYAKCVELDLPIFVCAGIPGPRLPFAPQEVARIDQVMYDFPELVFVTRHGCEPWEDLAVKLMLKWPNLYYSTSAFAPEALSKVDPRLREYPRRRQSALCGVFPDGALTRPDHG